MDTPKLTTEEQDLQDALDLMPEEVQDFMWSEAFDYIIESAATVIPLSPSEATAMKQAAYAILLQLESMDTVAVALYNRGIDKEKVLKILYTIDTEILSRAKILIENELGESSVQDTNELAGEVGVITAPSPLQAIASIKERLAKPSFVAPSARDYSVSRESPEKDTPPSNTPSTPSLDMYRELPEK